MRIMRLFGMKSLFSVKMVLVALLVFAATGSYASDASRMILEADSAYAAGESALAVQRYDEIISRFGNSAEIQYNLGNAYSRGGDYGRAMLAYQRALRLDPGNAKVKANINYIRNKVLESNKSELRGKKYSLESESDPFFTRVGYFIARDHASDTWALWAAVCFILFIGCVALYIFASNVGLRKTGFFGGFVCLVICVVSLVFAFSAASYRSAQGVIVAPKVKLRTEASVASKEAPVNLTRGTLIKIIDIFPAGVDNPQWYKVRLNSDFVGWIQASDFEAVGL